MRRAKVADDAWRAEYDGVAETAEEVRTSTSCVGVPDKTIDGLVR